ncbi:MAG: succinylglutamate desuccinylase/aspartoacylase family protein, partial [Mogibacterium sp.]|nr:succinylglutamate desuccinylase/aspartoacylase family protein [Mogibacterium sp.]
HASNLYLTEIPQVRINELFEDLLVPYAKKLNVDFIWVHGAATVLEATLAHSLNSIGTPTLVVEMGIGLRLTQAYGEQLVDGIFSLMKELGIWSGECAEPREPLLSRDPEDVSFLNAPVSGVFIQHMEHNSYAQQGQLVGEIVDPLRGECLCKVLAPCTGVIFTLRDFPIVDEGSLIGRMLDARALNPEQRAFYEARGARPVSSLDLAKYRKGQQGGYAE